MITMLNMDCMEFMKNTPDKAFELACVDPPYGMELEGKNVYRRQSVDNAPSREHNSRAIYDPKSAATL